MTRATVSADGDTITVHIPITFRKRGGRKLGVTPDGAECAPRARLDNAMAKALARAFRWRKMLDEGVPCDAGGTGPREERARDLRKPGAAADAAGARYRGGDPRRAATGGHGLDDLLKGLPLEWAGQRRNLAQPSI